MKPAPAGSHGTHSGYSSHRRRGEAACGPCKDAHRAYTQEITRRRLYGDTERLRWGTMTGRAKPPRNLPKGTSLDDLAPRATVDSFDLAWRRRAKLHAYGFGE